MTFASYIKTRTQSTHALIFGAQRWIAVATSNIHTKTNKNGKKTRTIYTSLYELFLF